MRCRADASLRPGKRPRGLILSTGEDTPRGQSLLARLLVLEVSEGDLSPHGSGSNPGLSACQQDAATGKYAAALAGFLAWLAPRLDAIQSGLPGERAALRDRARADGQHARTPAIIADLTVALRYLLDYARSIDAIPEAERDRLWKEGWAALLEAGAGQSAHTANEEPAEQFLRLLEAALAGGYAHLADDEGNEPPEPQRWGWRPEQFPTREGGTGSRCKAQGTRVGWLVDGQVYLEPETSYAVVQSLAREQNESFSIRPVTLRRRLKASHRLRTTDTRRDKLTVRKMLQGQRRNVLHLDWPRDSEVECSGEVGPEARADQWAANG
jgi:hypothetical protein